MKNSTFIRIISIFGIIALLSLQYVWLRNAYQMVEQEILEKSKTCLKESLEKDLFTRLDNSKIEVSIEQRMNLKPGERIVKRGNCQQSSDMFMGMEDCLTYMGLPCKAKYISSIFNVKIKERLGFIPQYTLQIINDSTRHEHTKNILSHCESNNFTPKMDSLYVKDSCKVFDLICDNTIFIKVGTNKSFEMTMTAPTKSVITKAKYIFMVSLLLVLLIGVILLFQLKSMIKDKEFTKFMKDYTRILAHEFRTPINDIYLLTSSIMNNKDLSLEKIALYNQEKLNQCSKMLLGIDNLLLLAKSEQTKLAAHKTLTDMRLFINKIADKYRNNSFMRKNLKLETSFTPEDCQAYIDPDLMENVLVNLVENAIKYSNEEVEVSISCAIEDKQLILKIKDNGFGISESDLKHIFQIFERGKKVSGNQIKGFGIGLYYVSLVVKAHQGKVEVLSEEGKGSEFVITIPNRFL